MVTAESDEQGVAAVVAAADAMLYRAKAAGRNRVATIAPRESLGALGEGDLSLRTGSGVG